MIDVTAARGCYPPVVAANQQKLHATGYYRGDFRETSPGAPQMITVGVPGGFAVLTVQKIRAFELRNYSNYTRPLALRRVNHVPSGESDVSAVCSFLYFEVCTMFSYRAFVLLVLMIELSRK